MAISRQDTEESIFYGVMLLSIMYQSNRLMPRDNLKKNNVDSVCLTSEDPYRKQERNLNPKRSLIINLLMLEAAAIQTNRLQCLPQILRTSKVIILPHLTKTLVKLMINRIQESQSTQNYLR